MCNDTAFPKKMVVWTQNRICRRNLSQTDSMNIFYPDVKTGPNDDPRLFVVLPARGPHTP